MWICCGKTDIGKTRENNQDCFKIQDFSNGDKLSVVCDGMGGAAGGSVASNLASDTFAQYVKKNIENTQKDEICTLLSDALLESNKSVYEKAQNQSELLGMGTTLCAVLVHEDSLYCLSVGDSRIYIVKNDTLVQLSHDHSFVQTLVDSGQLSEEEAKTHPSRNIITKAVGTEKSVEGDFFVLEQSCADKVLICSDGLCGYVADKETEDILKTDKTCQDKTSLLVDRANDVGGFDNITVVLMEKTAIENS